MSALLPASCCHPVEVCSGVSYSRVRGLLRLLGLIIGFPDEMQPASFALASVPHASRASVIFRRSSGSKKRYGAKDWKPVAVAALLFVQHGFGLMLSNGGSRFMFRFVAGSDTTKQTHRCNARLQNIILDFGVLSAHGLHESIVPCR